MTPGHQPPTDDPVSTIQYGAGRITVITVYRTPEPTPNEHELQTVWPDPGQTADARLIASQALAMHRDYALLDIARTKLKQDMACLERKNAGLRKIMKRALAMANKYRTYRNALRRSQFDVAPCGRCGRPVVCLPSGEAPRCTFCAEQ